MSLSEEITRIQNAKSDMVAAIIRKGGTVPEGTKIEGLSTLIANLPAGISLKSKKISRVSLTLSAKSTSWVDGSVSASETLVGFGDFTYKPTPGVTENKYGISWINLTNNSVSIGVRNNGTTSLTVNFSFMLYYY